MEQRTINFLKMTSGVMAGMESEKSVWEEEKEIAGVCYPMIAVDYHLSRPAKHPRPASARL